MKNKKRNDEPHVLSMYVVSLGDDNTVRVLDRVSGIICSFKIGSFNETQKFDADFYIASKGNQKDLANDLARTLRELGDYLVSECTESL